MTADEMLTLAARVRRAKPYYSLMCYEDERPIHIDEMEKVAVYLENLGQSRRLEKTLKDRAAAYFTKAQEAYDSMRPQTKLFTDYLERQKS